jgi:hypothetical protein
MTPMVAEELKVARIYLNRRAKRSYAYAQILRKEGDTGAAERELLQGQASRSAAKIINGLIM